VNARRRDESASFIINQRSPMETKAKVPQPESPSNAEATWNTPEAIAEHRAMSPEQRVRKAIALSQAALRFASAPRVDAR